MEFTKTGFDLFRKKVEMALKEVGKELRIDIEVGKISYEDVQFDCKLKVKKNDVDADRINWEKYCMQYGLKKEDYGKVIKSNGANYKLIGFDPKKRKFSIVALDLKTNNKVGMTESYVINYLERSKLLDITHSQKNE